MSNQKPTPEAYGSTRAPSAGFPLGVIPSEVEESPLAVCWPTSHSRMSGHEALGDIEVLQSRLPTLYGHFTE